MGKYTVTDKDFAFEQWYRMGKPSMTKLCGALRDLKEEGIVDMSSSPNVASLIKWKKVEDWDGKAEYRDNLTNEYIEKNTASVKSQVINYLLKASKLQLEAQIAILESAKLTNLEIEEARALLGDSVKLGSNGATQVKQALEMIDRQQNAKLLEESSLQDILNQIESGVEGGEKIRNLLASKLTN